jgi:hypothetical protein
VTKLKPVLWMLSGVVLGSSATALAFPDQAPTRFPLQVTQPAGKSMRVTSVFVGHVSAGDVYFVRDTKSGGCWLATVLGEQSAVAVAPKEACE